MSKVGCCTPTSNDCACLLNFTVRDTFNLMNGKDIIVFDLETKKEFAEIGGRDRADLLGVSVLGAYSYNHDKYFVFEEHELPDFEKMLANTGLLVGYNIKHFDIPVLQPYISFPLSKIEYLDLIFDATSGAGFRPKLDNLARTTLGVAKSADGLQALRWYREGKIQEIKDYCLQDVKVTRGLYEFGQKNGFVKLISREAMGEITVAVKWGLPRVLAAEYVQGALL